MRSQGSVQLLQRLPGTKLGIEQLFSYLELTLKTSDFRDCLLMHRQEIRCRGMVYHYESPDRERSFYDYFDLVFDALEQAKDYKQRLCMIFNGRKHAKQLQEVQKFRCEIEARK